MTTDHELAVQIALEHAAVGKAVNDLEEEIASLRAEPTSDLRAGRLIGMLRMFRIHLQRHFELEEKGGFLSGRVVDASKERIVERLIEEHREFDERLGKLLLSADRSEQCRASLTDLFLEELAKLISDLRHHEKEENTLVQKLVVQDMGVGD